MLRGVSGTLIWIGLLTVVCVGLVLGLTPAALAFVRAMRRRSLERNAVEATADARVVDKRSRILGTVRNAPDQRYYATFEFPDGNRLELEVTENPSSACS